VPARYRWRRGPRGPTPPEINGVGVLVDVLVTVGVLVGVLVTVGVLVGVLVTVLVGAPVGVLVGVLVGDPGVAVRQCWWAGLVRPGGAAC